jgi:O-antigen/teichoic acid export membrane protein
LKIPGIPTENIPFSPGRLKLFWSIPLYRNAAYLIMGNGISALVGFAFWAVAARFYSTENVGIASAVIAAMGMLGAISHLGLGLGLVRYLPGAGQQANSMINSSLTLACLASILTGLVFISGVNWWAADLAFLQSDTVFLVLFLLYIIVTAVANVVDNIFVAQRRAGFVTLRAIIFSLGKLALAVVLAGVLKAGGIVHSWGMMLLFWRGILGLWTNYKKLKLSITLIRTIADCTQA